MDNNDLDAALCLINTSVRFMLLLILGILLSFASLLIQRQQVCDLLSCPETAQTSSVFPLRLGASALVIGALGFFFCLSLRRHKQACAGDDPAEKRSSRINAAASTLVLAAALLRLDDLLLVEQSNQTTQEEPEVQPPV